MRYVFSLAAWTAVASIVFVSSVAIRVAAQPTANPATKPAAKPAPPTTTDAGQIRTPNDLLAAVKKLAVAGKIKEANKLIDDLRIQAPPGALVAVLGLCYEIIGSPQRAVKYHAQFLRQNPTSLLAMRRMANFMFAHGQVAEGVEQAQKILSSNAAPAADNEANRAWARQKIATAFVRGSYPQLKQGLELIGKNGGLTALSDEDLLIKARLLGQMPDAQSRNQSIELLKQQIAKEPKSLHDSDHVLLAQLCVRLNRWPEARKVMKELVQARMKDSTQVRPEDLAYVAELIRMMIRNGEPQSAKPYLAMLDRQKRIPGVAIQSLQLRAASLFEQGQGAEATRLLTQAARDVWPPDTPEKLATIKNVSLLFVEIERYAQAEALLRAYAKIAPGEELVLAQFLGLNGDVDEALGLCKKVIDSRPSDRQAAMQVAMTTLNNRRDQITKAQIDRVTQWAAPLLDGNAGVALKVVLAELRGDYATVEQTYREILSRPGAKGTPQEASIMNNLAFTLGYRRGRGDEARFNEALGYCDRAIKILGERSELLDTRATIYFAAGKTDLAHTDMTKALKDHVPGGQATQHFHMAMIEHARNNPSAAATQLRAAIDAGLKVGQLSSDDAKAFRELSRLLTAGK